MHGTAPVLAPPIAPTGLHPEVQMLPRRRRNHGSRSPPRGRRDVSTTGAEPDRESLTSDTVRYYIRSGTRALSSSYHHAAVSSGGHILSSAQPGLSRGHGVAMHSGGSLSAASVDRTSRAGDRKSPRRRTRLDWTAEAQHSPYGAIPMRGDPVAIVALRKIPEYNGRVGLVAVEPLHNQPRYRHSLRRKPRYAVTLPGWSQLLNLRLENLCVLDRHQVAIRVGPDGLLGMTFHKDDCGWLVTAVKEIPGQPKIRRRDIIVTIGGHSLMNLGRTDQNKIVATAVKQNFDSKSDAKSQGSGRDLVLHVDEIWEIWATVLRTPARNRSRRSRSRRNKTAHSGSTNASTHTSRRQAESEAPIEPNHIQRTLQKAAMDRIRHLFTLVAAPTSTSSLATVTSGGGHPGSESSTVAAPLDAVRRLVEEVVSTVRVLSVRGTRRDGQLIAWARTYTDLLLTRAGIDRNDSKNHAMVPGDAKGGGGFLECIA